MILVYMVLLFILGILLGHLFVKIGDILGKKDSITSINFNCDSCSHKLNIFEKLYITRLLTHKGRCKYCNERIKRSNALLELLTGVLFALALYVNKETDLVFLNTLLYIVFISGLIIITASDYHHMIIPDVILIILGISIIVLKVIIGINMEELTNTMDIGYSVIFMLLDAAIMFIIMYVLQKIGNVLFKTKSLGFGDVKLMAIIALMLGYKMSIVCLFISCFMALPIAIYNLQKKDKKLLPFGPYLAFGAIILVLCQIDFDMIIDFIKR